MNSDMEKIIKIGILRETKTPPDKRVPLTPPQIAALREEYPLAEFYVQPSPIRCYTDEEYAYLDIPLKEDLSDCDLLLGVKEVDKKSFIRGKSYLFFSHVAKEQPYNRDMLRIILENKIKLIDYEYLTTDKGQRVVAFGRWAGIVGAYNGLRGRGIKTNRFKLKPAHQCHDLEEMWAGLRMIALKPGLKILVTGEGRVAGGIMETLAVCNPVIVSPEDFLTKEYDVPVVCQIGPQVYNVAKDGRPFDFPHFISHPDQYISVFPQFTKAADILITGHFWDPQSPVFFSKEDMKADDFKIRVIADVSCDIDGPIPSTIRSSTITDPFYGVNRFKCIETTPFEGEDTITVMAIDNLPGELPRDASLDFGRQLMEEVIPALISANDAPIIRRATICEDGRLTEKYSYLKDYVEGK